MGNRHHLYQNAGRLCLSGGGDRPPLAPRGGLVDAEPPDHRSGPASIADGGVAQEAEAHRADPLGPGIAVHQHGLGVLPEGPQPGTLDEPSWQLP